MRTLSTCPDCGKQRYKSRKEARRTARTRHPGERLSPFRCGAWWHVGHLPPDVVAGRLSRSYLAGDPLQRAVLPVRQLLLAHLDPDDLALVRYGHTRVQAAVRAVIARLGDHSVHACPACRASLPAARADTRNDTEEAIA